MAPDMMTSSQQPPPTEDGTDSNYAIAAAILAVVLICIIIAVVLYSFYQRHNSIWYHCRLYLCPCSKPDLRNDDLSMGYLPAHITVNPGALQQGIPDIFLRGSQAGRISMEGNSYDSWRGGEEGDSVTETSGMWAEYLRRATLRRRSSVGGRGGDRKSSSGEDDLPFADCGKSGADLDNRGITNGAMVINDVSNSRDDAMDESVRDDIMNNVVNDGSGN